MKNWHVLQTERYCEIEASVAVASLGIETYVPMLPTSRIMRGQLISRSVPRFSTYIFASFDRDIPGWQELRHGAPKRAGVAKVLADASGVPVIVPTNAIEAVRAYKPRAPVKLPAPYRYHPGEPVVCTIGGARREAVFVEYCGNTPHIRIWMFGAERLTPVSSAELEPIDKHDPEATLCA